MDAGKEHAMDHGEINPDPTTRLDLFATSPSPVILVLDRVTDPLNLGVILRLADAGRLAGIYGYQTEINLKSRRLNRISRQTMDHVSFQCVDTIDEIKSLSKTYTPIALEYTNQSIPYHQYTKPDPCMLVLGSERNGVSDEMLELCHTSLHIPMLGMNSSMNVSTATGIVLYHLLNVMKRLGS